MICDYRYNYLGAVAPGGLRTLDGVRAMEWGTGARKLLWPSKDAFTDTVERHMGKVVEYTDEVPPTNAVRKLCKI